MLVTETHEVQLGEKEIRTTKTTPGHAHTAYEGICGSGVTVQDVQDKIYHPMFRGRGAAVSNGKWRAIRHTD